MADYLGFLKINPNLDVNKLIEIEKLRRYRWSQVVSFSSGFQYLSGYVMHKFTKKNLKNEVLLTKSKSKCDFNSWGFYFR